MRSRPYINWLHRLTVYVTLVLVGFVVGIMAFTKPVYCQVPISVGPFLDGTAIPPVAPLMAPMTDMPRVQRTYTPLPWHLVMPPPEPIRYPDMSFFGYTTGRIIPRDFLDSNGQTLR